jgi:hypothetical protein
MGQNRDLVLEQCNPAISAIRVRSNIPTSIDFVILILPYGPAYRNIVNPEIFTT